jgi:hypothetical protein
MCNCLVEAPQDATLWYPEVDMMWGGPFRRGPSFGSALDRRGNVIELMGNSLAVLRQLATEPQWKGVQVVRGCGSLG